MLILKLFIFALAESGTLWQILNLPTVKRGGTEPLYIYKFGKVFSSVNQKNDLATRLTVTKKIKMDDDTLRQILSVISARPVHKTNRRRIPAKRSSRFNRFRKYHSR